MKLNLSRFSDDFRFIDFFVVDQVSISKSSKGHNQSLSIVIEQTA